MFFEFILFLDVVMLAFLSNYLIDFCACVFLLNLECKMLITFGLVKELAFYLSLLLLSFCFVF